MIQQGRRTLLVTERVKKAAVQAMNKACRKYREMFIRDRAMRADASMESNWTKPCWDALTVFKKCLGGKPNILKETRMKFADGTTSTSAAEDCAVFRAHIENLFKLPAYDEDVINLLDQRETLNSMDALPTPTEIFNASRRLRYSAGGEDGLRAEHLRAACRHKVGRINIFHDFVVKYVQEWWQHGHERDVPHQWECETVLA